MKTFIQNEVKRLLRVTDFSRMSSVCKSQCLLLFPGLALRSQGSLVLYVSFPNRSWDVTETWNSLEFLFSFCLSQILPLYLYSLFVFPSLPILDFFLLHNFQEATRINFIADP